MVVGTSKVDTIYGYQEKCIDTDQRVGRKFDSNETGKK